ncbi:barstar family protein [Plantactinospora sp. B5E13]|uniref:barstar family protein n=1 Tax=unclassified Plantactinospora TaxID=2631981 RepID=UPI00325E779D
MPEDDRLPRWLGVTTVAALTTDATVLDGAACRTRAGLYAEWARVLHFPDHFGHNWDAFADSLRDTLPVTGTTLVLSDAGQLLVDEAPAQLGTLLAILDEVAAADPSFRVVLQTAPVGAADLVRRLSRGSRSPSSGPG